MAGDQAPPPTHGNRNSTAKQGAENTVDEAPRASVDKRQCGRDDGVIRCSEPDLLGQREAHDHPRLAVVRQALAGRPIDQRVEVRDPPKRFARDRYCKGAVRAGKVANSSGGGVERQSAPKHGIEHLQRGAACAEAFNAWHCGYPRAS